MSDKIKIPEGILKEARTAYNRCKSNDTQKDYEIIARWMREECAKEVESWKPYIIAKTLNVRIAAAIREVGNT